MGKLVIFILFVFACVAGCVAFFGRVAHNMDTESKREVDIVYQVEGSGRSASIMYSGREMNSSQDTAVRLPWSKSITISGFLKSVSLTATNDETGGTITCRILADGREITEQTASGPFASANCFGDAGKK